MRNTVSVRQSPALRRRRLAAELRRLRSMSGMTADQAATEIGVAKSTLSRIENGQATAMPLVAATLLKLYRVSEPETESLLQLARDARKRGWWVPWKDVIPPWALSYVGLESDAVTMHEFQPLLVPGLLQTAAYAEALFRATLPRESDELIKRRVEFRVLRQQREEEFRISVVISEAALRIPVGGPAVMQHQLHQLTEVADAGRHNIQVLPAAAREHGSMGSGFIMLRFADPVDPPMAYIETRAGSIHVEEADEVQQFASLYEHLCSAALNVRDSVRMIEKIAETIECKESADE
jgi:transcriptional regulator with XRE-family HTH domain